MVCQILGVICLLTGMTLFAQEWPQWRGPSRDAIVGANQAPAAWPGAFNRQWRVDVGEGYSSPVIANGRVFVHSRKDPNEVVTAIDLNTGKVAWQQTYASSFNKNSYAVRMGKGPNATPLVVDGRVFTLGASGHLHAWDAATGKPLWSKDFSSRVDTSKLFCGTSASPILVNGALIVQIGSDTRGGSILALDPASGAVKWETKGDGPGYATPIVIDVTGSKQIVAITNRSIVGLEASSGKLLWTAAFPDEWHENIVTPVWTGTLLIMSGVRQGTHAYSITNRAGTWTATEVWKNADVTMYMSSPVFGDGVVYGLSAKRKGQFVALDVKSGATKWATEGREAEHASALLTPRHVFFLTNTGAAVVAKRATAAFEIERKYELADSSETWAAPIILGSDLIVRDSSGISRFAGK